MQSRLTATMVAGAVSLVLASPLMAQTTGVSHPEVVEGTVTTNTPVAQAAHQAKPSPAILSDAVDSSAETEAPPSEHYVRRAPVSAATPDSPVLHTHAPESTEQRTTDGSTLRPSRDKSLEVTEDLDSGIVTEVRSRPGELNSGSLLRARLETRLSTEDSPIGTHFTARLEQPIERHGEVLIPAGTILTGRVADVHGGSRLRGGALLRLQPDSVSLPDGTVHALSADLVDLDNEPNQRVDSEGVVHKRSHPARDLSAAGLATGSGAVAGALIGGGIGAVVGAGIAAGVSTVVWLRHDQQEVLPVGTMLVFSLSEPLSVRAATH